MTRINTNVSSLTAQKSLARSNVSLQQALTRLSTGLRINVGKDDPAGLIASEVLRSDIISAQRAITNGQRANQVIATADSALGQVSSLLNDIRGLVTEAANSGAMSEDQIAANQLQVDSSLEALNRIAQTTSFQGRKLLDGSLDFITTAGTGFSTVVDFQIDQANLGATGSIAVDIDISVAATQAQITTPELQARGEFTIEGQTFTLTATTPGETMDGVTVDIVQGVATGAVYGAGVLTVTLDQTDAAIDASAIVTAINTDAAFENTLSSGTGTIDGTDAGNVGTAVGTINTIQDIVMEISGASGAEVFNFQAGATVAQIVAAVNLVSDATGVSATNNSGVLELDSTAYGSNAFVAVDVISEDTLGTFETNLSAARDTGTDVVATVNGVGANADGNEMSINTATLDLTLSVTAGSSTDIDFTITGGGALFQLGPDVVSNQQARLGIPSVNAATLRGASGRLYQLGSGESAALATDPTTAARIVDQVISKVTSLRGRLGAFQKTTLETNINSLTDTVENLVDAESQIRDADFAAETAALTRAQILVQSGVSVLAIANTSPQNVLALLR